MSRCPTCKAGREKPVPGVVLGWRTDSTYTFDGEEILCDCAWQNELRIRYLLADIPEGYWRLGAEDYYGDLKALEIAEDYLEHWNEYRDIGLGLEFYSRTQGTGKTFLLTYVARQLIQRGERVHYRPFRSIMGLYEAPYAARQATADRLQHSTVLALDEVGTALSGAQGDYFAMEFENLMRDRIDAGKPTLMTTNLAPDELDKHYPRTYSLLAANQKRWAIGGVDVRREGSVFEILKDLADRKEQRPIR